MPNVKNSQQKHALFCKDLPSDRFLVNQLAIVKGWTPAARDIFNQFITYALKGFKRIYAKQVTIGERAGGYCRETVYRMLPDYEEDNLLFVLRRLNQTNCYWINEYLFTPEMRELLGDLLPALKNIPIVFQILHPELFVSQSYYIQEGYPNTRGNMPPLGVSGELPSTPDKVFLLKHTKCGGWMRPFCDSFYLVSAAEHASILSIKTTLQ
jgi:hypothetical protein